MIIQFTVENFLSFKEPATLSLAASALKEKQTRSDEIVFELEGTNLSLLKSAVIYGANASGKSNLVKALDFFKWFVINSSKGVQSGESIRVESFRLNRRTEQEPSYFEAVFADETVQYRYGFEGFFVKFGGTSSIVNKESWLSVVYFLPYCTSAFLAL